MTPREHPCGGAKLDLSPRSITHHELDLSALTAALQEIGPYSIKRGPSLLGYEIVHPARDDLLIRKAEQQAGGGVCMRVPALVIRDEHRVERMLKAGARDRPVQGSGSAIDLVATGFHFIWPGCGGSTKSSG